MRKLVAYRLALAAPQLVAVSLVVFALIYLVPGSPAAAILGDRATPASIARLETQLGLDRPVYERLGEWLGNAVVGDLGTSLRSSRPVSDLLLQRLPATLSLTLGGLLVALVAGVALGVLAALRPGGLRDRGIVAATSVGMAVPEFWFGLVLSLVFAVELGWVPVVAYTPLTDDPTAWLRGLVLPSIALGVGSAALIARQTRTAMTQTLTAPYVDTLTAAGVPRARILRYAFKNATVPMLATLGITFRILLATSFVVEVVFAFPGVGSLLLSSVIGKDFPVVQGGVLVIACLVIAVNLLIDVGYGLLNPRVRLQ
jgi:peptide/nickel transport system permease protein